MSKVKSTFCCQSCGAQHSKWLGQCSSCKQWNTIVEEIIKKESTPTLGLTKDQLSSKIQLISDVDFNNYTRMIEYKNYSVGIVMMLESDYIKNKYPELYETSKKVFVKNYENIVKNTEKYVGGKVHTITTRVYSMSTIVDYKKTIEEIHRLYKKLA